MSEDSFTIDESGQQSSGHCPFWQMSIPENRTAWTKLGEWQKEFWDLSIRLASLSSRELRSGLKDVLNVISSVTEADRLQAHIFSTSQQSFLLTESWRNDHDDGSLINEISPDTFPWLYEQLTAGIPIWLPELAIIPAQGHAVQDLWTNQQIQSVFVVPLISENRLVGLLIGEYTKPRAELTESCHFLLHHACDMLAGILRRKKSEKWSRVIQFSMDRNPTAVLWIRRDSQILYANRAASDQFGYSQKQLCQMSVEDLTPDHRRLEWRTHWSTVSTNEPTSLNFRYQRKDGSTFPVDIQAQYLIVNREEVGCLFIADTSSFEAQKQLFQDQKAQLEDSQSTARIGSFRWDVSSGALYWSKELYHIYGCDPETFDPSYESYMEMIHPKDREAVENNLKTFLATGSTFDHEYRLVNQTDREVWVSTKANVSFSEDGSPDVVHGVAQDITKTKHAEKILADSLHEMESILSTVPDAVVKADRDGTVLFINRVAKNFDHSEVIGSSIYDYVKEPYTTRIKQAIFRAFEHGATTDLECEVEYTPNDIRVFNVRYAPIYEDNKVAAALVGSADITKRRIAENLALEQQAQLERVAPLSMLGELSASITHELTQPLNAICQLTAVCEIIINQAKGDTNEELIEAINDIKLQSDQGVDIIHHLRNFTKQQDHHRETEDLNKLVQIALDLLKPQFRYDHVDVSVQLLAPDPMVNVNRITIQQVLVNLLKNACDAMRQVEDRVRKLSVSTSVSDGKAIISIVDSGHGILPEISDRLFESFVTSKEDGMGIGLTISRNFVIQNGGTIEARPNEEFGTSFQIAFPLASQSLSSDNLPLSSDFE